MPNGLPMANAAAAVRVRRHLFGLTRLRPR